MEQNRQAKSPWNKDLSDLPPSVRAKALRALDVVERLERSMSWTLGLFGMGAQAKPSAALKS